jgi:hypothetical protein
VVTLGSQLALSKATKGTAIKAIKASKAIKVSRDRTKAAQYQIVPAGHAAIVCLTNIVKPKTW